MGKKEYNRFVLKTESLVKPEDVTAISFLGDFNKLLSKKTQDKVMHKGSRNIPYMGFIVDPYCFFLSYKIRDTETARSMLPAGYELTEAKVFKKDKKYPMLIISAFSARTSAFIGTRLEFYIIAREKKTGKMSWIIADYETDTNSHDPKNGFTGYTSDPAVFTTTPYGELLIDFREKKGTNEFSLTADLKKGKPGSLDETLWIEGNMSVDYGGKLKDESSKPFGLIFDPALMNEAVNIPLDSIKIKKNSWFSSLVYSDKPECALYFPYSQHFIIRQNLESQNFLNKDDLQKETSGFLASTGFKTMKGSDIKKPLITGFIISALINTGIIVFLLLKLLL